jgi:hypothetical protein
MLSCAWRTLLQHKLSLKNNDESIEGGVIKDFISIEKRIWSNSLSSIMFFYNISFVLQLNASPNLNEPGSSNWLAP